MQGFIRRQIPLMVRRLVTMLPAFVVIAIGIDPTRTLVISQVVLSFGIPFALVPLVVLHSETRHHGGARQPADHNDRCVGDRRRDHRPQHLPARPDGRDPGRNRAGLSRVKPTTTPTKEPLLAALLLVLLLIVALFIIGFAVVKFLIWIAIILAIIWLIGFFVRGVEGARWYRW